MPLETLTTALVRLFSSILNRIAREIKEFNSQGMTVQVKRAFKGYSLLQGSNLLSNMIREKNVVFNAAGV